MRWLYLVFVIAATLLPGCAYRGTVLRKDVRPLPFSESLGIDAIYRFQLRDNNGQVHEQMVTPEIFASYEVGDYFDDLRMSPRPLQAPPPELQLPRVPRHGPTEIEEIPYQPIRTTLDRPVPHPIGQQTIALARGSAHSTHRNVSQRRHSSKQKKTALFAQRRVKESKKSGVASRRHIRRASKVAKSAAHRRTHERVAKRRHRKSSRTEVTQRKSDHQSDKTVASR